MIRLYVPLDLNNLLNQVLLLPAAPAHHLTKVLRAKVGTSMILFDGAGQQVLASLHSFKNNEAKVLIKTQEVSAPPSPLTTHLGFALAKRDHFEIALQKAVELGVNIITPLITERCNERLTSEQLPKKMTRWQAIIINACEQSGNNYLPALHEPQILKNWLLNRVEPLRWLLHPVAPRLSALPAQKITQAAILIGPEGGFTEKEIDQAQQADFKTVCFGPRILRTETAPLVALTLLQYHYGDLRT